VISQNSSNERDPPSISYYPSTGPSLQATATKEYKEVNVQELDDSKLYEEHV